MSRFPKNNVATTTLIGLTALSIAASVGADESTQDAAESALCEQAAYTMGLRYQQQSAEVAALQRQGFALATLRLEQQIDRHGEDADLAIITDLDETVLDNSALLARDMEQCHDYTTWDTWRHWEREGTPGVIPGAMEFLEFADEQGVAIYYVSDRYQENKEATLATLNELGLPQVSDDTVLLLGPPKQERRDLVEENHTLVMLLGDTLHDFAEEFVSKVPLADQHARVEEHAERFGRDWIVFPNATYGTWSDAPLEPWEAPLETD
ncbi:5'-nucleotidase, lipoprotein e(P4) family [Halomonas heilongjiangensis]|uniref:5'-nucleotidase, lipoprotein e(P4) family n=1 Tax=Halomonas heilongjiangensis TaxID=1387883 RepID=A0A2N7TUS8_9GAMM|nr:5'-nucleotidase, lipoprotein e(P4) family [Halomonas heilongjiangensis]PMR71939.1 5'-nucleotidase, lipoprotein e(P4) family [Halomonas heilongjiangensis]PXX91351.1 5'-nucleotidase, lipoprotein e(P4) family [Halomonas heilongjiangensis]